MLLLFENVLIPILDIERQKYISTKAGNYAIDYEATDNNGNTANFTIDVKLIDDIANIKFTTVDKDVKKEVSKYSYKKNKGITLEEFLSDVTFKIDNYSKVCKNYQENSFLLEVDATNDDEEITSHKIPLKLEDNC